MSGQGALLYSGLSAIAKITGAMVAIKLLSSNLGPDGVGRAGQLMSFLALLAVLSSGGIGLGITQLTAKTLGLNKSIRKIVGNALFVVLISSALISFLIIVFAPNISNFLFHSDDYTKVFRIGSIFILPIALVVTGSSFISGYADTRSFAFVQMGSALFGVLGLFILIYLWDEIGATIGLIWMSCSGLPFVYIWAKRKRVEFKSFEIDKTILCIFWKYSVFVFISAILQNFTQIYIRGVIQHSFDWTTVGYWQSMTRISDAYLQPINVFLISYFLPNLSAAQCKESQNEQVFLIYKIIMPLLAIGLIMGYLLRDVVVTLFLTDFFRPVRDLFVPQMLGDFFKVASFIPGYLLLARGYAPLILLAELLQFILSITIATILVPGFGAIGACWSYVVTYLIYFIISMIALATYSRKAC